MNHLVRIALVLALPIAAVLIIVLSGDRSVDLSPQNAFIRRQQHELIRESTLISHSYGKEPTRRVRVYHE